VKEYRSLGEFFQENEAEIEVAAKCPVCGTPQTPSVNYRGVYGSDLDRRMGDERDHIWTGDFECTNPKCKRKGKVRHFKHEYPEGVSTDGDTVVDIC